MGWRGAIRSIAAAQRRAERTAVRRQHELERQHTRLARMAEVERATYEVDLYENHIERLLSMHKDASPDWDWLAIRNIAFPRRPEDERRQEKRAEAELGNYTPSAFDKVFGRTKQKRAELLAAVEQARQQDAEEFRSRLGTYNTQIAELEEKQRLAISVLAGDIEAYIEVIKEVNPFSDIAELGSSITVNMVTSKLAEAILTVNSEQAIPKQVKTLLKSGILSVKAMPKTHFYELYQDYVCSCVYRVARELFALLPLEIIVVTAVGEVLNTSTGHLEEKPVLSIVIPKRTLTSLNLDTIDPSNALSNFVHRMEFKKTQGFGPVKKIEAQELETDG